MMIFIIIKMTSHNGVNCNSLFQAIWICTEYFGNRFAERYSILEEKFRLQFPFRLFPSHCRRLIHFFFFFATAASTLRLFLSSTSPSHLPVWSLLSAVYLDFHSISFDPAAFLDFKWLSQVAPRFHYCVHMPRCGRRNVDLEWDISFRELCLEARVDEGFCLLAWPTASLLFCIPWLLWRSVRFSSS
jgi:hypothetical protein